jgi:hypothetical protein
VGYINISKPELCLEELHEPLEFEHRLLVRTHRCRQDSTLDGTDCQTFTMANSPLEPTNGPTAKPHYIPHFATIPNEYISILTPYSGLLMTLWLVILFTVKRYVLEPTFPRIYGQTFLSMNDGLRRGFLVHHVSAGVKILLLIVGAKPFCDVVFGHSTLHSSFSRHTQSHPTMGDILIVLTQLFVALYIFELLIRKSPSPIAVLHHTGAVLIAQSAVALSLDTEREVNATMEYILCLVWAAFDVLSELWLNLAFILYRVKPENHSLLAYVFLSTCIISVMGTVAETVMVMTLFGQSWDKWELSFKVVTPILHVLFTVAQMHSAKILYVMWKKQKRLLYEEDQAYLDAERGRDQRENKATSAPMSDQHTINQPGAGRDRDVAEYSIAPSSSNGPSMRPSESEARPEKKTVKSRIDKFFLGRS